MKQKDEEKEEREKKRNRKGKIYRKERMQNWMDRLHAATTSVLNNIALMED